MERFRLTGNQLKILAAIAMTLDHIGAYLFPSVLWLRMVGRLAFPIFAFMVGEGGRYTRSPKRYFLTMAAVALVCQTVELCFRHSLYQCVLVTFTMSIGLIWLIHHATQTKTFLARLAVAAGFLAALGICELLPRRLPGFTVDYGILGVLAPVAVFLAEDRLRGVFFLGLCLAGLAGRGTWFQWLSLGALPLLLLYNGQRGRLKMKWFFYLYYPIHLVVIYFIGFLL